MTFDSITAQRSGALTLWCKRWLGLGLLSLLLACGGGGGGSIPAAAVGTTAPTIALTRGDSGADIFSGTSAILLAQYNYGSGVISWVDGNGLTQKIPLTSAGTTVQVNPTQTTVYTLSVVYQDPQTIRPSLKTATTTLTVTVKNAADFSPDISLTASASSITLGGSVTLLPTFSLSAANAGSGTITGASIVVNNTTNIVATSGVSINQAPIKDTTYSLVVNYVDTRVIPNKALSVSQDVTVGVTTGPSKLSLGGSMITARSDFTATLLPNNMLLVAGGIAADGITILKAAELYDPLKNVWKSTGDMKVARRGHAATLMQDGKVLVTGGFDGKVASLTAEIYDPSTGAWTSTGSMNLSRRLHTTTLLNDGTVLVAGGIVGPAVTADGRVTEIYDPLKGAFTASTGTAGMSTPRTGHSATLLNNGKVLVAGKFGTASASQTTEIYDPVAKSWSAGPSLNTGRYNHAATLLLSTASSQVLVSGGFGTGGNTAEIYDSATNTWTPTSNNMNASRALHTSTLLRSGKVLVIGGYDGSNSLDSMDSYDPNTDLWTADPKILNRQRAMHASPLLSNGKVLILGTYFITSGTPVSDTEIWSP